MSYQSLSSPLGCTHLNIIYFQFVPGKRAKTMYLTDDDNYTYVQKYTRRDPTGADGSMFTMWTCSVSDCKAGAFTKKSSPEADSIFNKHTKTPHNHVSNIGKIPKLHALARAREQAIAQPSTPPRALFAAMAKEVSSAGEVLNIKQNTFNRMVERDRVKEVSHKRALTCACT